MFCVGLSPSSSCVSVCVYEARVSYYSILFIQSWLCRLFHTFFVCFIRVAFFTFIFSSGCISFLLLFFSLLAAVTYCSHQRLLFVANCPENNIWRKRPINNDKNNIWYYATASSVSAFFLSELVCVSWIVCKISSGIFLGSRGIANAKKRNHTQ